MPTYLYTCNDKHTQEVSHSITHDPDIYCEVCKKMMNRKPQTAGVQFYGKGFYTTDKND